MEKGFAVLKMIVHFFMLKKETAEGQMSGSGGIVPTVEVFDDIGPGKFMVPSKLKHTLTVGEVLELERKRKALEFMSASDEEVEHGK